MLKQKPTIKITFEDTLIMDFQDDIDRQFVIIKLSDDDILSVIKKNIYKDMRDYGEIFSVFKCEMLVKLFEKYIDVYKDNLISKNKVKRIASLNDVELVEIFNKW